MSLGLEATMKMMDAIEDLIVVGGLVFEDGKISFKDIVYARQVMSDLNVLVSQAKLSSEELKDLDKDELIVVVQKLIEVVAKAAEPFMPK